MDSNINININEKDDIHIKALKRHHEQKALDSVSNKANRYFEEIGTKTSPTFMVMDSLVNYMLLSLQFQ